MTPDEIRRMMKRKKQLQDQQNLKESTFSDVDAMKRRMRGDNY